jgi:hypothetical protein
MRIWRDHGRCVCSFVVVVVVDTGGAGIVVLDCSEVVVVVVGAGPQLVKTAMLATSATPIA